MGNETHIEYFEKLRKEDQEIILEILQIEERNLKYGGTSLDSVNEIYDLFKKGEQ